MDTYKQLKKNVFEIEEKIGYEFKDKEYLYMAFIHRSFTNECKDLPLKHYERLEFLGDSVLGFVVAEYLYEHFPSLPEGRLSLMRSSLVDEVSCASYMKYLDLGKYILLGRGELLTSGKEKTSILADVFEAIVGAIYLDGGYDGVNKFLFENCFSVISQILKKPQRNYKAELQDYSQKKHQTQPKYKVIKEEGPDHKKIFFVAVLFDRKKVGQGQGGSKKDAEQDAAKDALKSIDEGKVI